MCSYGSKVRTNFLTLLQSHVAQQKVKCRHTFGGRPDFVLNKRVKGKDVSLWTHTVYRGGQSAALQLIFAALGPFLLFGKAANIVY